MLRKTRKLIRNAIATLRSYWWIAAGGLTALTVAAVIGSFVGKVPLPDAAPGAQSSRVLAVDGQAIDTFHGEVNRTSVGLDQISVNLQHAVVSAEDRHFYSHPGVDPQGILRALFADIRGRAIAQGGSTISQQYVRNAFSEVGRERTVLRKVREAALAVKLERRYSKRKILEFYLNTIYFGRGAYGAEAAARTYFNVAAKDLSVGQSAFLAGAIRAPLLFQAPEAAKRIRDQVLQMMVSERFIKPDQAATERKRDLVFVRGQAATSAGNPRGAYFVEYVRRALSDPTGEFKLSDAQLFGGGLVIHTTLDMRMQDAAEKAVASTFDRAGDPEAALVAMDPQGNVRAMVGGRDVGSVERARGFNYAAYPKSAKVGRQVGSAFKPFTLGAFVDAGYSIDSTFDGPPQIEIPSRQCMDEKRKPWKVSSFGNESFPPLNVTDATVHSVNTVYAQMVDLVTPKKVAEFVKKAGITEGITPVCSIALGSLGVTPLELARAYATFAARGKRPDVVFVTKIVAPGGRVLYEKSPHSDPTVEQNTADVISQVLQQVIKRGTGTGAGIGKPAAGKTGTTENHVDAWFAGYTTSLVAVVWNGFPPKEVNGATVVPEMTSVRGKAVTGGAFPATMWKKFMAEAMKGLKAGSFPAPSIKGQVVTPPSPCPDGTVTATSTDAPSPSPTCSPLPSPSPSPSPPAQPPPSPPPSTSPTPSPAPSHTKSPG
jgi:penicillin-binding protein 1A